MVRFQMNRIGVNQFAILRDQLPEHEISLATELSFQYSAEGKQVACITGFKFKDADGVFLILQCQCSFLIHPEDWNSFESKKGVSIPESLLETLATHTIGTSRGILFCRTEGTPFNSLMIPPINVHECIQGAGPTACQTPSITAQN